MAFTKRSDHIDYSPQERRALAALQHSRVPLSTDELCERIYQGREKPWNARKAVTSVLRGLIEKVTVNREAFRIVKSKRSGPYQVEYRITQH
jgi:hypothetical protein